MVAELGLLTELTTVLRPPEGALEEEEEEDRPPSTESSSSKFLSAHDPEEAGREGKTNKQTHLVSRFHVMIHSESMIHHLSALIQLSGGTCQSSSPLPASRPSCRVTASFSLSFSLSVLNHLCQLLTSCPVTVHLMLMRSGSPAQIHSATCLA